MAITSNITALEAIVTWMNANQNKILLNDVSELVGQISQSITQTETALTELQNTPSASNAVQVTQLTSVSTGVIANSPKGTITTATMTVAAGSIAAFVVTNSFAKTTSVFSFSCNTAAASHNFVNILYDTKLAGSFGIMIVNTHPTLALTGELKIDFTLN